MRKNDKIRIVLCTVPQQVPQKGKEASRTMTPPFAIVALSHWMAKFGYSGDFYDINMLLPSEDEILNFFEAKQPDIDGILTCRIILCLSLGPAGKNPSQVAARTTRIGDIIPDL